MFMHIRSTLVVRSYCMRILQSSMDSIHPIPPTSYYSRVVVVCIISILNMHTMDSKSTTVCILQLEYAQYVYFLYTYSMFMHIRNTLVQYAYYAQITTMHTNTRVVVRARSMHTVEGIRLSCCLSLPYPNLDSKQSTSRTS